MKWHLLGNGRSPRRIVANLQHAAKLLFLPILLAAILAILFMPPIAGPTEEGRDYVSIANLDYSTVHSYYGGRILHPLTVRLASLAMDAPIDGVMFLRASAASLIFLFGLLAAIRGQSSLWILLLIVPVLLDQYRNYYWPELFHAALGAGFFLALLRNCWTSLPLLFLLYMTRESTMILVGVVVVLAWQARNRAFTFAAAAVGVAGMAANSVLVAPAIPNRHGIPLALLYALKIPYNFLLNIMGLMFWVNTNADTTPAPLWTVKLPGWLHLGGIQEIGYSGFHAKNPAATLLLLLTAFGIMPMVAVACWRLRRDMAFAHRTAMVYGTAMLALTPLIGTAQTRYILAAWPLFWVAAMPMLDAVPQRSRLIALSVCVAWLPALARAASGTKINYTGSMSELPPALVAIVLLTILLLYAWAWHLLGMGRYDGTQEAVR